MTLLESLAAVVVAALGILGIVGVQMRTLTDTQTSVRRAQAIRLIEDLDERMKAAPSGLATLANYQSNWLNGTPPVPPATDCQLTQCDPAQLAQFNLSNWMRTVQNVLPKGDANIFLAPGDVDTDRRLLGVMISWRQNESYTATTAYLDNTDATLERDGTGVFQQGSGGGVVCPPDRTCHLQYISATNRCTPDYSSNPSVAQYYCLDGGN